MMKVADKSSPATLQLPYHHPALVSFALLWWRTAYTNRQYVVHSRSKYTAKTRAGYFPVDQKHL